MKSKKQRLMDDGYHAYLEGKPCAAPGVAPTKEDSAAWERGWLAAHAARELADDQKAGGSSLKALILDLKKRARDNKESAQVVANSSSASMGTHYSELATEQLRIARALEKIK